LIDREEHYHPRGESTKTSYYRSMTCNEADFTNISAVTVLRTGLSTFCKRLITMSYRQPNLLSSVHIERTTVRKRYRDE
jgi:hypothetical protein